MEPTDDPPRAHTDHNLVTLCAWSNTLRYDGEWISIDKYLSKRFGLSVSHGISPEALARFEAELDSDSPLSTPTVEEAARDVQNPKRLAALKSTGLLDSAPNDGFDRITRLGAALLKVPATFISLVDAHRDFYLSNCGFGEPLASGRELSGQTFCHFTIHSEAPLVIPDTRADPVYRNVPTVESLGVAAYLGAPLTLLSGEVIGSFCAIDTVPRQWTSAEIQGARDLASLVLSEIELRQAIKNTQEPSYRRDSA